MHTTREELDRKGNTVKVMTEDFIRVFEQLDEKGLPPDVICTAALQAATNRAQRHSAEISVADWLEGIAALIRQTAQQPDIDKRAN